MSEHASKHEVQTCAEHATITTGKPCVSCQECGSIFFCNNGDWKRYRPEEWVIEQIENAPGGGQAFPVGAIFLSMVATDPATLLGYGTWSAIGAGRMLVGFDSGDSDFDALGAVGGEKTVTLTEAQMPSHAHGVNDPGHTHLTQRYPTTTGGSSGFTFDTSMSGTLADNTLPTKSATTGITTNSAGSGAAHSNLPPYLVCMIWQRTA